jgi:hypothetical protein
MPAKTKAQQFLEIAREAFGKSADSVAFSNAIYGVGGPLSRLFPTQKEREAFLRTEESREIEAMMESLPEPDPDAPGTLTLRLPPAMREELEREAAALGVGLVALCTMKLAAPFGRSVLIL